MATPSWGSSPSKSGDASADGPAAAMGGLAIQPAPRKPRPPEEARSNDLKLTTLPPKPQTAGFKDWTDIYVYANHFDVVLEKKTLYQYHVEFQPDIDNRRKKAALLHAHAEAFGGEIIFDGMLLWSRVRRNEEFQGISRDRDDNAYQVTVNFTAEVDPNTSPDAAVVQVYNVLFRRNLRHLTMANIGRNHYYINDNLAVSFDRWNLKLHPGFVTALNSHENGITLNADVVWKTRRTDTVLEVMNKIRNDTQNDETRSLRGELCSHLIGRTVITLYNGKTYRIDDIDFGTSPKSQSFIKGERQIGLIQYYREQWNKDIVVPTQPLLKHVQRARGTRPEVTLYIVPELCYLTGLSDDMRGNFGLMRDLSQTTRTGPQQRAAKTQDFVNEINTTPAIAANFGQWGVTLSGTLKRVPAMLIPEQSVVVTPNRVPSKINDAGLDWIKLVRKQPLVEPKTLDNWHILSTGRDERVAMLLVQKFQQLGRSMGITALDPFVHQVRSEHTEDFEAVLQKEVGSEVQLVVIVLPNDRKERYDAVKKMCAVRLGIPSQCVIARNLSGQKSPDSIVTKILLQVNAKLGGDLWGMEFPEAFRTTTMIVGIDVTHGASGPSVAGFCASLNSDFTKYYTRVSDQNRGAPLISALSTSLVDALREYRLANDKRLPQRIIVYRDGVGDGMLKALTEFEIPQFQNSFRIVSEKINKPYDPQFTFVVVKKRINTRLFYGKPGRLENPLCGTLVTEEITQRGWWDFFLVSQKALTGTVAPTHYHVVLDHEGATGAGPIPPNVLQLLSYRLCHLYYNWTGPVRVPAPVAYARKAALIIGQHIRGTPKENLNTSLWHL